MPVPFKVKAVFDYKSDEPDDLKFGLGQIITVIEDDDDDWYTGEYEGADGKVEGIFPRNFVEKYEPAIPSRPVRGAQKPAQPPVTATEAPAQSGSTSTSAPQVAREIKVEPPAQTRNVEAAEESKDKPVADVRPAEVKSTKQPPPPVVDKPASNSFKDRIAAFNKASAAPVTPFKPAGSSTSSNFIKKPFVAPPPNRNSYVPPPTQAPQPTKIYRREEDPEMLRQEEEDTANPVVVPIDEPANTEDQPKPTSLKDRIALLQQQQMEQAQRTAEKKKVKKPAPPQRTDSADNEIQRIESTEAPLTRQEDEDDAPSIKSVEHTHTIGQYDEDDSATPEPEVTLPTVVPPPPRELTSDTNDADDSGAEDTEDARETSTNEVPQRARSIKSPPSIATDATRPSQQARTGEETAGKAEVEGEEEDTEEDEDPDVRRRRELRERMAKMSGGMGMMGMFGPPGGLPPSSKKPKSQKTEQPQIEAEYQGESARAPPVPVMAMPGMSTKPQHKAEESDEEGPASPTPIEPDRRPAAGVEDYVSHRPARTSTDRSGPTSPYERTVPAPPPREVVVPPPAASSAPLIPPIPQSPPSRSVLPPPPPPPTRDEPLDAIDSTNSPSLVRTSLDSRPSRQLSTKKDSFARPAGAPPPPPLGRTRTNESVTSTYSAHEKRGTRPPPPPPAAAPTSPQTRAPPPPPPGQPPSRSLTGLSKSSTDHDDDDQQDDSEDEVTEYDGDYDTDIASSAKHKDALKAHNRDSSVDGETLTDKSYKLPSSPPARAVPPLPPTSPPRDGPPPLPPMSPPKTRASYETPRMAPPPIPTAPVAVNDHDYHNDNYDSNQYAAPSQAFSSPPLPQARSPPVPYSSLHREEEDMYSAPSYPPPPPTFPSSQAPPVPPERMMPPPPSERAAPPPPPHSTAPMMAGALGPSLGPAPPPPPRQSIDVTRSATISRRSTEQSRPSADFGFMAADIDLSESSMWWTYDNTPPPSIGARTDVLFEVESNTATKRGGKTTINRDVYVLYMDYSQTTINVSFDPSDAATASLSQSHQRPPPPPRQDQLESVSHSFGSKVATAAAQASGTTVADGTAVGMVWTLLQPFRSNALMPVGNRSFGAPVYANLANASTQQFDEIRHGDIVTFRNAKFAGHKGGLHQKYSMEVGQPGRDHVAVVLDWDGTKKKIRAWEQGREEKKGAKGKVREESFRIGDLKSGEVRVWRIMGRSWVGWDQS